MAASPYQIPSLAKACRLLQLVAEHQGEWTSSELARAIATPRTTTFRMLQTLVQEKFVVAEGSSYRLGPGLVRLGLQTLEGLAIRRLCVPFLRELSREFKETVHLAILCDERSLLLEVCDYHRAGRLAARPGSLVWLHASATGKVLLAGLDQDRRDELLARLEFPALTPASHRNAKSFSRDLKKVAKQGYGLDDGEYVHGVRCLAVPVLGPAGQVFAAIGLTSSPERLPEEKIPAAAARLQEAARALSVQLAAHEES